MAEIVYAIRIGRLITGGLKVLDVKIGKTTNINSTINQYKRSSRDVKVLDLWEPNNNLTLSECERGVHQLAQQYAHERDSEKFIFLQDTYDKFSKNVCLLLKKTSMDEMYKLKTIRKVKNLELPTDNLPVIKRNEIPGSSDELVAIFPSKEKGLEFIKKYNAWGYVKMNKKPKYVAFYLTKPYSSISYIGEFNNITNSFKNKDEIENIEEADKATFKPGKSLIYLKKNSLKKLSNPIECKHKGYVPQGLIYTTLDRLKKASDTDDLRK